MATARNVPPREDLIQTITIDSTLTPTPQGALLDSGTQVDFTNNSGYTINITFNPNPPAVLQNPAGPTYFTNITNLANGATSSLQTPSPATGSVNYTISAVGGPTTGPFAIQLGDAPIFVVVSYVANAVKCTPLLVAVPQEGEIQMENYDTNLYGVGWPDGDPLDPVLTSVGGPAGNDVHTATEDPGDYPFTASLTSPILSGGGGKVRVVSS